MAKVQGKYTLSIELPTSYELTGNARNANFTFANNIEQFSPKCVNRGYIDNGYANISFENKVFVKRGRIYAAGGQGLQAAQDGTFAGQFLLVVRQFNNGSGGTLDTLFLRFPKWDEWYNIDGELKPFVGTAADWSGATYEHLKPCRLGSQSIGSYFTCDDFNVQEDYVGQTVTPILELEIETGGLVGSSHGDLY